MTSTATQPIPAPQGGASGAARDPRVTASEWFASGARRPYDPVAKTILETAAGEGSAQPLHIFEKVVAAAPVGADTRLEHAVLDPVATVTRDVERLRSAPAIPPRVTVSGHVYDVVTGMAQTILTVGHGADGGVQRPQSRLPLPGR